MTREQESERLARLTELAQGLLEEVQELAGDNGEQLVTLSRRARSNRRLILAVIAGFTLDIALTIAMAFGLIAVTANANRIDTLTHRLDLSQTETRQWALCPLYQVFLDMKSPEGRKQAPDPKKYDQAFSVIEDGYRVLDCATFSESDAKPPTSPKG